MGEQVPSVGRIVHYRQTSDEYDLLQPFAAIITFVHSAELVNLTVFDHDGGRLSRIAVKLSVGQATKPGCWNWPPRV